MASSITTSIFLTLLSFCLSEANDFLVGGSSNAWKVPSSPSESLNKWAEANRFQIGDTLVWKIDGSKDSVLQVSREGYLKCNVSDPLAVPESKDGVTTMKLERSGAYYFISGAKGACKKGQRVIVVVMSLRSSIAISPAPSPMEAESPAPVATNGVGRLAVVGWGFVGGLLALGFMGLVVL